MASNKRERELARERYQRQQARRLAVQRKAKQRSQVIAAVVAVLAVLAGISAIAALRHHDDKGGVQAAADPGAAATSSLAPAASGAPAVTPSATTPAPPAGCAFTKSGTASRPVSVPTLAPDAKVADYTATIALTGGTISFKVDGAHAPCAATSFAHLAKAKFFDKTPCHRLTTGGLSVLQCGDPTGSGSGGPGYSYAEENLPKADAAGTANYAAGVVALANAGKGTSGSQIFLVYKDSPLPPSYTVLGTITSGLDVLKGIGAKGVKGGGGDGAPAETVTISSVTTTDKATA